MRVFLKNYSFCLKLCFLHVISILSSVGLGAVYDLFSKKQSMDGPRQHFVHLHSAEHFTNSI